MFPVKICQQIPVVHSEMIFVTGSMIDLRGLVVAVDDGDATKPNQYCRVTVTQNNFCLNNLAPTFLFTLSGVLRRLSQ